MNHRLNIAAVLPVYNEADVLAWILRYLIDQGIYVRVLDNDSSDESARIARAFPRETVSVSTFSTHGEFNEHVQGEAVQDALRALQPDYDWLIKCDADEFIESPWQATSLRQAIEAVDRVPAYNCIGARAFLFLPMAAETPPPRGADVRKHYDHFKIWRGVDRWTSDFHTHHREVWKIPMFRARSEVFYSDPHRVSPLSLIRMFPDLFIVRHYPYRSLDRTKQRLLTERRDRLSEWNIRNQVSNHYVRYSDSDNFLFDGCRQECERWSEFEKAPMPPALRPLNEPTTRTD